jgi:hypothetical protein
MGRRSNAAAHSTWPLQNSTRPSSPAERTRGTLRAGSHSCSFFDLLEEFLPECCGLAYLDKRFSISANNDLQAGDLQALQQQKAQLDALRVMVKALAPAIVALDKQSSWKLPQRHRSRRICPCEGDVRDPKHSGKTPR